MTSTRPRTPQQEEKLQLRKRYGVALALVREAHNQTQDSASAACDPEMTSQNWGRYETGSAAGITDPVVRRGLLEAIGADEAEFQTTLANLPADDDLPALSKGRGIGSRMARLAGAVTATNPAPISPDRRQAIFPVRDGEVVITFPRHMTPEGRREMKQYLELLLASTDDN